MIPKFRAWDKEDEAMCEVDVIGFSEGAVTISNENVRYYHLGINEVVLMQYTGLKDKNGVEIYEGDIVKHIDTFANIKTVNKVYRKRGSLVFDVKIDDLTYDVPVYRIHPDNSEDYKDSLEVLGNIYEHPHLIEEMEA